jgi:subtilase family serine protease
MRPFYKLFVAGAATMALAACGGGSSAPSSAGPGMLPQSPSQSNTLQTFSTSHFLLPSNVVEACPDTHRYGYAHCLSLVRTDVRPDVPSGYGPSDLQSAYNLHSTLTVATVGGRQTVAIVDAYDNPDVEANLATYRSTYGLPACTTANGCFEKVNQEGDQGNYPTGDEGWGLEMSLDVDMVSAGCPTCKILVVEATSSSSAALGASVDEAVKLGAGVVSNSYDGGGLTESDYTHPGKVIVASAGDDGYGIGEPAGFPSVVSAGGTTLVRAQNARGWNETAWNGTGSGCTTFPKPVWQKKIGCAYRVANDVSAVANPNTGVAVYDTYGYNGFLVVGGTSVSSPFLGSLYGLAANEASVDSARSLWLTKNHQYLNDVTQGTNGNCTPSILCTAGPGWDGPTGWGTPNGIGAF